MKIEYQILETTLENFLGESKVIYEIGLENCNAPGTFFICEKYDTLEEALTHVRTVTKKIKIILVSSPNPEV